MGFFDKLKQGLSKTKTSLMSGVDSVLKSFKGVSEELFEELFDCLIMADLGVPTAEFIMDNVKAAAKAQKVTDAEDVKGLLIDEISKILQSEQGSEISYPAVILVIGVNGVGKTTSIGKLANAYKSEGKSVMLAAGDTFRAAAAEQLQVWGERAGVPVIKNIEGTDPAAVVFDALKSAKAKKVDVLICDTAGRLHNKKNLMDELKKISRIVNREYAEAHVETFLVLDATNGQNALNQAKIFKETADITGIILTKLDGTAKGGIVIAISKELNIPVRFVGVGEGIDDLLPFDASEFAKALF